MVLILRRSKLLFGRTELKKKTGHFNSYSEVRRNVILKSHEKGLRGKVWKYLNPVEVSSWF